MHLIVMTIGNTQPQPEEPSDSATAAESQLNM